jgi:hypothetical protein
MQKTKRIVILYMAMSLLIAILFNSVYAQSKKDTIQTDQRMASAEDPSQFFTRIEIFNELQYFDKDYYLNQTIWRTIIKIGNRLTTRVDIPWVYNTKYSPEGFKQSGLGDITFRLLGYRFLESPKSAVTASIEFSLNTAESPLLGSGKNLIIPLITYSRIFKPQKMILSLTFQQANSFSGDETRKQVNFSKFQTILVKKYTSKIWTVFITDWFADYENGGLSMNARIRAGYGATPIFHFWTQGGAGIFGDFFGRYQWTAELGARFFILRKRNIKTR